MIRTVLVSGKVTDKLGMKLSSTGDIQISKKFETTTQLIEDILNNSSSYTYIDKIVVTAQGFETPAMMTHIEQFLNIQSLMNMEELRCDVYFLFQDSELMEEIDSDRQTNLIYKYAHFLKFEKLDIANIIKTIKGKLDRDGIYHPDSLVKDELDEQLNSAITEEDTEYVGIDKTQGPEVRNDFIDTDAEIQKRLKEEEREERKKGRSKKEKDTKIPSKKVKPLPVPTDEVAKVPPRKQKNQVPSNNAPIKLYEGIIAFTGDRQSGVSTTIANAATIYAKMGYNTLIIDLDMKRRSQAVIFDNFDEAVKLDSRVANGLLVSLANPRNLESVVSTVEKNISVLSISTESDREIKKFANRPIEQLYSASTIISLLSFAKSLYDVVLVDLPFETLKPIGSSIGYVDRIVLCIPNTEHHLNTLLETELEDLIVSHDIIGHQLMSKASILLTRYNQHSRIYGKEATEQLIEGILHDIDDPLYHLNVVGMIPNSLEYERQFDTNKRIVATNRLYEEAFVRFLESVR